MNWGRTAAAIGWVNFDGGNEQQRAAKCILGQMLKHLFPSTGVLLGTKLWIENYVWPANPCQRLWSAQESSGLERTYIAIKRRKEGWGVSSCWSFSIGVASVRCITWPPPSTGCLAVQPRDRILNNANRKHPTLILIHGLEYQRRKMLHAVRWRHFISAKRIANGRYFDDRAADILAFN